MMLRSNYWATVHHALLMHCAHRRSDGISQRSYECMLLVRRVERE